MSVRIREGGVSVDLVGEEALLDDLVETLGGGAAGAACAVLEAQREESEAAWYAADGVERKTGLSGRFVVRLTFDLDRDVLRADLVTGDTRRDRDGKPIAAVVRRPSPRSMVSKKVSREEYWATPKDLRGKYPYVKVLNPKRSDGKSMIQVAARTPLRLRVARGELAAALARFLAEA